jgi:drug/metabolite transporter (DMT)-like permease
MTSASEGRRPMKYLVAILAIAIGVAAVVAGGADDSPGLQLIGLVIILGAVVLGVRTALRSR